MKSERGSSGLKDILEMPAGSPSSPRSMSTTRSRRAGLVLEWRWYAQVAINALVFDQRIRIARCTCACHEESRSFDRGRGVARCGIFQQVDDRSRFSGSPCGGNDMVRACGARSVLRSDSTTARRRARGPALFYGTPLADRRARDSTMERDVAGVAAARRATLGRRSAIFNRLSVSAKANGDDTLPTDRPPGTWLRAERLRTGGSKLAGSQPGVCSASN